MPAPADVLIAVAVGIDTALAPGGAVEVDVADVTLGPDDAGCAADADAEPAPGGAADVCAAGVEVVNVGAAARAICNKTAA